MEVLKMGLNETYRVKDLYLASYLYSQQKNMRIERESGVCWFIFEDKKNCEELAQLYWTNTATGKVKALTDAIRSLKDLIFAHKY